MAKNTEQEEKVQPQETENTDSEKVDDIASDEGKVSVNKKQSSKKLSSIGRNKSKKKIEELEIHVAELKDKNLRLFAEFDNFRKRNAKERLELLKTAEKDLIYDLLPVMDDFARAQNAYRVNKNIEDLQNGFQLIYQKFKGVLETKGLKPMESIGEVFDTELHDAITDLPAPKKKMRGKVMDEIEKGYYLRDKIIRHAKVVVGK